MRYKAFFAGFMTALALASAAPARAAGTTPLALQTQFDNSGNLLSGCLLYFFVAGTVATPQAVFQDFGLSQPAPNPLSCSAGARVPQHWISDGLVHIRLTDQVGTVVLDTTMQTLGPSSGGGGGGGGGVDPTGVAQTGDIKARLTSEVVSGWVILNATTIGSATSGATQRANADTQNLFVYLWTNCPNAHCPVPGGRGASGLADFNANKQITLPDMRDRMIAGRDCMNASCAGILLPSNITSGGTDTIDTPGATGGVPNQTIALINLPALDLPASVSGLTNGGVAYGATVTGGTLGGTSTLSFTWGGGSGPSNVPQTPTNIGVTVPSVGVSSTGTAKLNGSGTLLSIMNPFALATFYQKL